MTARRKTAQELAAERELNFDTILEPYREGGTKENPVTRTVGTIMDYFMNKKKYPPEIVAASVLTVFKEIKDGKEFRGDGTYGSPGREMITYIRVRCDQLLHKKQEQEFNTFARDLQTALNKNPGLVAFVKRNCLGLVVILILAAILGVQIFTLVR